MDIQTIDNAYQQLQNEGQQVAQQFQTLAGKLQAAAQGGNADAREWMLDLRELALAVQGEQQQVGQLLQAIHGMWQNQAQQYGGAPAMAGFGGTPMQAQGMPQAGGVMGMLGNFLNSGFGRSMEIGAGMGLGEDLINRIF
ncbi:MAG: hypothetical protein KGK06_00555 [Xanthomonadaceae bacterium]|nr:hypothetical protein [Xanthomonadaceae bacterium]